LLGLIKKLEKIVEKMQVGLETDKTSKLTKSENGAADQEASASKIAPLAEVKTTTPASRGNFDFFLLLEM